MTAAKKQWKENLQYEAENVIKGLQYKGEAWEKDWPAIIKHMLFCS